VTYSRFHRHYNQTVSPSSAKYSSYQKAYTDSPVVSDISGVPTITPLASYTCVLSDITFDNYDGMWHTAAYANGNTGFTACRFFDDEDSGPERLYSALRSTVSKSVQIKSGYPRNVISATDVGYDMSTEAIEVFNDSLGQEILPVGNWYRVPEHTNIRIIKRLRIPVIFHYNDMELSNVGSFNSYTQKQLDKSTTWQIDTNIDLTRAIDPGSVDALPNVTHFTETIGLGLASFTIGR
jgi:hypothetical protein